MNACLVVVSVTATLLMVEVGLRLTSPPLLKDRYVYWQRATYEGFYFHYHKNRPAEQPFKAFHAVRGWTNFSIRRAPDGYLIEDLSENPWRGTQRVPYATTRKRIILIGDSFMYGYHVARDETIDHLLSVRLGSEFEVINLSTGGYGLDQMVLVANEVIPQPSPDVVLLDSLPMI